ncbi:MAG: DUF5689 domain-containing protein [Bacteroidales bacterium]|nr:DUF5689 domain-containing protein [Bacteroidales bacterium]MCM1148024.1 DUF5689 domain-containing protein [Bacteroidales bacterium]MCM1206842.1 DUF5689 domain-containing protein [Bacillota bacterium]MCM1511020.1 DUF5689 domain-containing protein [Clostridium sp.]
MKKTIFALTAFATALLTTSCMDGGYGDMDHVTAQEAYGNNDLKETHVVSLSELETLYPAIKETEYRGYKDVDQDIQVKLRVTANDIGGNIYNYIACEDATSNDGKSVLIYIYSGGLFSYLPIGQEILVDLKGLCVGTNGNQPAISTPYMTSSGNTYPKNMPFSVWQQHVKLLECHPEKVVIPEYTVTEFKTAASSANIGKIAGRVVKIKDAEITEADGTKTWAAKSDLADINDFSVERAITGLTKSSVFINTSTSAKFANDVMPAGKVDITALVVRYGSKCQLTLRTAADVTPAAN